MPKPASEPCFPVDKNGVTTVHLTGVVSGASVSELRFGYIGGQSGSIVVTYACQSQQFQLLKGLHSGWLPVRGEGQTVRFTSTAFTSTGTGLCIGDVEVGYLSPSAAGGWRHSCSAG